MTANNTPSKRPTDETDLGRALRMIFRKQAQGLDGQLPAKVISYDRVKNVAMVQPLISLVTTQGQVIPRPSVASVPVLALGGGGYFINFPLQPGDTGWIEASDRDISLYMQSQQQNAPHTERIHSFEDGRFVPDVFAKYTYALDAGDMVISNLSGTVKIALASDTITVTAPKIINNASTSLTINAPVTTVNSPLITLNGQLAQGNGSTQYPATLQGPITVINDLTAAGKSVAHHTHLENGAGNQTNQPT